MHPIASYFLLLTSYFLLLTSYFLLPPAITMAPVDEWVELSGEFQGQKSDRPPRKRRLLKQRLKYSQELIRLSWVFWRVPLTKRRGCALGGGVLREGFAIYH